MLGYPSFRHHPLTRGLGFLRNPNPRVNGVPRFRHYQLTRGLGFLGLHRRPMLIFFLPMTLKITDDYLSFVFSFIFDILCRISTLSERHLVFFVVVQK